MPDSLFYPYYTSVIFAFFAGLLMYKRHDVPARVITLLLLITAVSEYCCRITVIRQQYDTRNAIYHVYNVVQAILLSAYFIYIIKPRYYQRYLVVCSLLWPVLGIANIVFFQPLPELNYNMLMLESLCFITASLYFIYLSLKNSKGTYLFSRPHFKLTGILLTLWSTTFFFWSTIGILYQKQWKHTVVLMYAQTIFNILIYLAIAAVLFFYPKKAARENI
jgi:hypothetical protein